MTVMSVHNGGNPATFFGREMARERKARGWSLRELAARTGMDFSYLSRVERGTRPPTEKIARALDTVWPERNGYFLNYYEESQSWTPPGFRNWPEHEDKARTLRAWSPGVIHGLLQTADYARAMLETLGVSQEIVSARLASRMARQRRIVTSDDPPSIVFVVDLLSLYRQVRSAEVMVAELGHLAHVARLPHVTMQVLPAVEHPASSSELIVTDSAAYVEHLTGGLVYTDETVTTLDRLFTTINAECFRASESLALIERLGEIWTGGNPLSVTPKADLA